MKVISENLPPPQEEKTWSAQNQTADVVANVLAQVLTNEDFVLNLAEKVSALVGSSTKGKTQKGN
jgi:hypothetical protein